MIVNSFRSAQFVFALFAMFAMAAAKPQWYSPYAYNSPLVASGAVVSREFHGNTAPYVAAYPYSSAYSAYVPSAYSGAVYV